ncbi:MAG: DinB family protein [Ardenticatenaceae bacterium]|nr:DinB family protein [Ardenticatenaceae bacterium]
MNVIQKPNEGEYAPYAIIYIDQVPDDGLVVNHLQDNLKAVQTLVLSLPPEKLTSRWADGEWTIKEILVHIMDTERIFCYRALRFARNDDTELPGFEQDDYVPYTQANKRKIADILEEYSAVRQATITFFNSFVEETLTRAGIVSGQRVSVRALASMIAGHELHHLDSIKENYL